ncbi:FHA domain-containing protein, partial [Escherichia coli]
MSYGTLTLHLPDGETAVVELTISEIMLGRSRQATVRLNDDLVSKLHARVTVKPDGVWLEDLAATNGTFIDGEQIPP